MLATTVTDATVFLVIPQRHDLDKVVASLPGCYSVTAFTEFDDMIAALYGVKADLVVCHQDLIDHNQAMLLGEIKTKSPASKILIIGPNTPIEIQIASLKHGARGYFNESLPLTKLHEAFQLLLHGEVWIERHVIAGLIDEISHSPEISEEQVKAVQSLSPKELEVAKLVSHGATNKMIARTMNITERTVKAHLTTIFQKMNLPDRLSLAMFFRDLR